MLTKPDGTGNFEENNLEHQSFIDDCLEAMNLRLSNIIKPTNPNCNTEANFLSDTKIQVIVNKIWKIDPGWDFLITGFYPGDPDDPNDSGDDPTKSALYPPNSHYNYLEDDQTIPEGINIVFANNSDIYQKLYVE